MSGIRDVTDQVPLNRIERRKIEFQDKITQAALKLFEERGVNDTSVASIIKEADIAHKTFFNHFPTKDHLLQHIVSTNSDYAYSVIKDAFKRYSDPRKRIEYCLIKIAKALEALHPHYRELINFYLIGSVSASDLRNSQKEKFSEVVNQILTDAKEQNLLRAEFSVETLTDVVVGIYVSTLFNWSVEEEFPLIPKIKKAIKFINASVFVEGERSAEPPKMFGYSNAATFSAWPNDSRVAIAVVRSNLE